MRFRRIHGFESRRRACYLIALVLVGLAAAAGMPFIEASMVACGPAAPWWLYWVKSAVSVILAIDINFITNLVPLGTKRSSDVPERERAAASGAHHCHEYWRRSHP